MKDPELEDYCNQVEAHFFRWKGRPGLLSPADFRMVGRWFEDEVPIEAALEGISDAFRAHQAERDAEVEEINSLAFCKSFVQKAAERRNYL